MKTSGKTKSKNKSGNKNLFKFTVFTAAARFPRNDLSLALFCPEITVVTKVFDAVFLEMFVAFALVSINK